MRKRRQVEILSGEHAEHTRHLPGIVDVVRQDSTMGIFTAHEMHPGGIDRNVFDIGAADRQHSRVFDPLNAVAEDASHG